MKKRVMFLMLLVFAFFAVQCASAIDVTLSSPSDNQNFTSTNNVTFSCSASGDNVTTVTLYTDIPGTFQANKSVSGTSLSYEITNIAKGTYTWNCKAENGTASAFASQNRTFIISYESSSGVTFSGTIANQTWNEDSTKSNAFDLDDYFSGTSLVFSFHGNSSITISVDSDHRVSFSAPHNWNGTESIYINATDGSSTAQSNTITLTVTGVNDAPYYSTIPSLTWSKNTNKTLNLSQYFTDPEGDSITYNSTSPQHINITISGAIATLVPENGWTGTEYVVFTASDGSASNSSNNVTLKVTGNNTAPRIVTYTPALNPVLKMGDSKTFTITTTDADNDTVTVSWYLGTTSLNESGKSYTYTASKEGSFVLKVLVSDGSENTTHSWTVTVEKKDSSSESSADVKEPEVGSILKKSGESASPLCGNGQVEEGENCGNCPQDVKCGKDEICKDNACVEKPSSVWPLVITLSIILFLSLAGGVAYYFTTRSKKVAGTKENVRNVELPTAKSGEQPPAEIDDFYDQVEKKIKEAQEAAQHPENVRKNEKEVEEIKEPETPKIEVPKSVKKYVKEMRKLNFSDEQIKKRLEKKGWSEEEINEALKKE